MLGTLVGLALTVTAATYGTAPTLESTTSLKDAVARYQDFSGKDILVNAKVQTVCKKKGCWMVIEEAGTPVRVLFANYGFFVPQTLIGRTVRAQGRIERKELSAAEAKHFAEDEGKSPEEAAKAPRTVFQFIATGVAVPPPAS